MTPTGVLVLVILVAVFVGIALWGIRTENQKDRAASGLAERKRPICWASHREWTFAQSVVKGHDAQFERVHNELRRHCRIGKIILKEQA